MQILLMRCQVQFCVLQKTDEDRGQRSPLLSKATSQLEGCVGRAEGERGRERAIHWGESTSLLSQLPSTPNLGGVKPRRAFILRSPLQEHLVKTLVTGKVTSVVTRIDHPQVTPWSTSTLWLPRWPSQGENGRGKRCSWECVQRVEHMCSHSLTLSGRRGRLMPCPGVWAISQR